VKRASAALFDYSIFSILSSPLFIFFGTPNLNRVSLDWVGSLLYLTFWVTFFPIAEALNGQTLGKLLFGLKVLQKNGKKISAIQAFKRRILDPIDLFIYGIVAIISVKKTANNQRLGDLWAGTVVAGGEETRCFNCRELMKIDFREVAEGRFECSKCGLLNEYGEN